MKKITLCMFTLCCFAFSWQGMAQSVATENFATSGYDSDSTILTINSGDITVNEGQPIQAVALGTFTSHGDYSTTSYCGSWYDFDLSVTGGVADGTVITNGCNDDFIGLDVTGFTTITITSNDIDDWDDFIYFDIDLEVTYQTPSCPAPSAMVASNITTSSADLAWTAGNTETTWNLEWKAGADFTPGNGEEDGSDTVTGTPEYNGQLTGLTDNTTYYVYYQADCGGGDSSSWAAFSFQTLIEEPDNDMLSGAITLTLDEGTACGANAIVGISNAATNDSGEGDPSCDDQWNPSVGNGDLWYQFTAPAYEVTLNVSNISGLTSVSGVLYSGTSGNLTEIGTCGNSWPKTYATLTAGETYYLRLWDYGNDQTGTFDLCGYYLSCAPATVDFSVESICGDPSGDFNVVVDVTDMGSAASLDVQDDQGNPAQVATGATTLTFGPYANGTDVVITVTPDDNTACAITSDTQTQTVCPPANDECDNAIALTVNADLNCGVVTSGTNLGATASSQTDDVVGTPNDDVWFSFVATSTLHEISLSNVVAVEGTSVDMAMGVYDATGGCANLVLVDDSDPNSFSVSGLTIGNTYLVRVYGYYSGSSSAKVTFDICVGTPPPPPANDDCANAIVINESTGASCDNLVSGTTVSASNSADYSCSSSYNEVWYEFTPSASASYTIERTLTSGTSSTYLSIYSGSCGSLTQINTGCYSTSLQETLTAGETYLISVATYNSGSVDFELCVYQTPTCYAPDSFSAVFVAPDAVDLSWEAPTEGTPESYNWEVVPAGNGQGNGVIASGNTTGLTATVTGLTADTLYDLYVQSDCGSGDLSDWSSPFTFNAGYCLPSGTSSSSYIDNFTTTDASGVNIDNSASGFATDNYGDYFDTHTVSLAPEESFDFSFEIIGGTVGAAVWVDWNNDYNFDTTEVMFTTTSYGSGPFTGTITVPAGTADGDYRMRVLIDWSDSNPGDDDACSFAYGRGEVEDYKITVGSSLSIIDVETSAFTYYPNPVKDKLTLNAQNNIQNVVVYNMLGQEVLRMSPNTFNTQVDMTNFNSGAYFVKVTVNDATKTIRIIKN